MRVVPPVGMRIPRLNFPIPARLHARARLSIMIGDGVQQSIPGPVLCLRVLHASDYQPLLAVPCSTALVHWALSVCWLFPAPDP